MLTTEMRTMILGNLGNRASGQIGGQTAEVAVLNCINQAIRNICIKAYPKFTERMVKVRVFSNIEYMYMPSVDVNNVPIQVLEITSHVFCRVNETEPLPISYITKPRYDLFAGKVSSDKTGVPTAFMWYNNQIYVAPFPPGVAYDLWLGVKALPAVLVADPLETIPLKDIWLDVIETFATYKSFHKLQQVQSASSWFTTYEDTLSDVIHLIEKRPDLDRSGNVGVSGARPYLDPFCKQP